MSFADSCIERMRAMLTRSPQRPTDTMAFLWDSALDDAGRVFLTRIAERKLREEVPDAEPLIGARGGLDWPHLPLREQQHLRAAWIALREWVHVLERAAGRWHIER